MAVSISKDQIIEFVGKHRDVLVLVVIVILGAWGYLRLREPLAKTVEQRIEEAVARPTGLGGSGDSNSLDTSDLVSSLELKRPLSVYRHNRSPFGTPAEQLRLRQEVQQLYQRGVDLYKAGKYELAKQQFNRVIRLDVTETRIQYPIPPSEYIRLADRQLKLRDLDSILAQANKEIAQAGNLESSAPSEAVKAYESALESLRSLLAVDPQGEAMGRQRFDRISAQVKQLQQTVVRLKRQTLNQDVDRVVASLNVALQKSPADAYGLLVAVADARKVQQEMQQVDPDASVVPASKRNQIGSLLKAGEKALANSLETVAQQVKTRITDAVRQNDFGTACECAKALAEAVTYYPDNRALLSAQIEAMAMYVGGLMEAGRNLVSTVTDAFKRGDYSGYDPKVKEALLEQISAALSLGALLSDSDRAQLSKLEETLRRIQPPPPLDTVYDLVYFRPTGTSYRVRLRERQTQKDTSLLLRLNRPDRSGFLLTQVDSRNRVVILSKPPEYAPSQFKMP